MPRRNHPKERKPSRKHLEHLKASEERKQRKQRAREMDNKLEMDELYHGQ